MEITFTLDELAWLHRCEFLGNVIEELVPLFHKHNPLPEEQQWHNVYFVERLAKMYCKEGIVKAWQSHFVVQWRIEKEVQVAYKKAFLEYLNNRINSLRKIKSESNSNL